MCNVFCMVILSCLQNTSTNVVAALLVFLMPSASTTFIGTKVQLGWCNSPQFVMFTLFRHARRRDLRSPVRKDGNRHIRSLALLDSHFLYLSWVILYFLGILPYLSSVREARESMTKWERWLLSFRSPLGHTRERWREHLRHKQANSCMNCGRDLSDGFAPVPLSSCFYFLRYQRRFMRQNLICVQRVRPLLLGFTYSIYSNWSPCEQYLHGIYTNTYCALALRCSNTIWIEIACSN